MVRTNHPNHLNVCIAYVLTNAISTDDVTLPLSRKDAIAQEGGAQAWDAAIQAASSKFEEYHKCPPVPLTVSIAVKTRKTDRH